MQKESPETAEPSAALSVDELHELIGIGKISRAGLYRAIRRGEIPSVKIGRRVLVSREMASGMFKVAA